MTIYPVRRSNGPVLRFAGALILLAGLAVLADWLLYRPPLADLMLIALTIGSVAFTALLAGWLLYRLDWIQRLPRIRSTVLAGYVVAGIIALIAFAWIAFVILIDPYDAGILALFASFLVGVTLALGYLHAATVSQRTEALIGAADALGLGRYQARADIIGQDELVHLAQVFNAMGERLEQMERKERQLDRLRLNLSAWIGYDLRTPLGSVRAILEALADGVVDNPETYVRFLRTSRRDINTLSDLIDDLYDMANVSAGGIVLERRPVDVGRLIAETLEGLKPLAREKGVALQGGSAPGIPPLAVDARQINRVFANLMIHAMHRTPAGGQVKLNAYPTRDGALIEVVDYSEARRPEEMKELLSLFLDEDDVRRSTDSGPRLSLAMASAIVQAHGSKITAENLSDKGLRLVFTLTNGDVAPDRPTRGM